MKEIQPIPGGVPPFPLYSNKKFVIAISILIALMVTDMSLVRAYDIISKQFISVDIKEILFTLISMACLATEFMVLKLIRPIPGDDKNKGGKDVVLRYRITRTAQYAIAAILIFVILQVLFLSYYTTIVLLAVILSSYILSIGILSAFLGRVLGLLKKKAIFMLLFIFALGSITTNAAIAMVDVSLRLGDRPSETRALYGGSVDLSKGKYDVIDDLYFISYIISFVTAWIATATLLSSYYHKLGKLTYSLLAASPMVFFVGQFIAFFTNDISTIIRIDQFFLASATTLITTLSKPLGGLMLAIGFWSMARVARRRELKTYLIISGFGFFLLLTSNQAILLSIAPYPPFGAATVTVMGLAGYLIVTGIYMSTVSLSHDTELRRSIRHVAATQSKLFDSMVSAEIEIEVERRVMEVFKRQSVQMERDTGVEPSLDDKEAIDYLKRVIDEIKK